MALKYYRIFLVLRYLFLAFSIFFIFNIFTKHVYLYNNLSFVVFILCVLYFDEFMEAGVLYVSTICISGDCLVENSAEYHDVRATSTLLLAWEPGCAIFW